MTHVAHTFDVSQAKLSASKRALAAAKSGAEGATAQALELRQQLSAERKRTSTLSTEIKHAGKHPLPELPFKLNPLLIM